MPYVQRVPEHSDSGWDVVNHPTKSKLISDDSYLTYGRILEEYCGDSIDEDKWKIPFTDGLRHVTMSFEGLSVAEEEKRLIKAYIVDTLSHYSSPSTCASKVKSLVFLFAFLHEKGVRVTALSTPIINLFRLWLDEIVSLSAERKNLIEADLHGFISFLREHNLLRPGTIVIPRPRVTAPSEVKRAPDRYTLSQLDAYFFDFSTPAPSTYRCLYLLFRMIPSRNQEVLSMQVDDFVVDENLLEIRIPTYKESANHRPAYQSHYRLANEYPENLLVRSLQEQRAYALKCYSSLSKEGEVRRLMVSPRKPQKVVSSSEFNAYLEDVCEELGVSDAYGKPARITMYSLRHANGAAMSRSTEIGPQEFSRAFAHNSQYSDDSYGYASKHDELQHTAPFTQRLRDTLLPQDTDCAARPVTAMRLKRLRNENGSYLIGTHSVCQEKECVPQFMRCVFCEEYRPDSQFIPEAEQCCELLRQRIDRCRATNDNENLEFNEHQLGVYMEFIRRAENGREADVWLADP